VAEAATEAPTTPTATTAETTTTASPAEQAAATAPQTGAAAATQADEGAAAPATPQATAAPADDTAAAAPAGSPTPGRGEPSPNANGARADEVHEALAAGEKPGPASEHAAPPAPVAPVPAHATAAHLRPANATHALRLAETALQLRELAEVAASRGAAHARLQLHPAELGGVEVRLRVTADGLTAAIHADRPEAVQALQQASAELRRALEQRGLNVLSVDVALAGAGGGHAAGHQMQAGGDRSASGGTTNPNGGQEAVADAMEADPTAPRGVPAGALVDVLA
jgi:flagellar hook-length control protein FliK